ncbi:leucyl/phenylalanyl-tRNA--protein transferase [Methyloceanibacter methanicus]|uniref:leucyl/phenylalanyl-tRNA--protein transferase n=1 Tax=Methyloceanibacter methanicus TaxID=1774968 RepID=UPI001300CAD4|nr:leucyl/phenylalanyl-tRNA--protein transferase [Methyloceanibacter methanicus]
MIEQPASLEAQSVSPRKAPAKGPNAERRAALFRETPLAVVRRWFVGTAWALRPKRIAMLLPVARVTFAHLLNPSRALPDTAALAPDAEIAGLITDLSPATLMDAYARGLFPHGHIRPLKWVCPPTRAVVRPADFHISSRLRGLMRQGCYRVTFDTDFEGVIVGCAAPRRRWLNLTWITPYIMAAYGRLFDEGHVHSFEVWNRDGELVGGGYGVAVGRVFVIESQFYRESNASKIGFAVLAWHLAKWGFVLVDNKWLTPATAHAGFREIPRSAYLGQLPEHWGEPVHPGRWQTEADIKTVAGSR